VPKIKSEVAQPQAPTIRLSVTNDEMPSKVSRYPVAERDRGDDPQSLPALLVSYYYLSGFMNHRDRYHYRDWVMDSGAFTAHSKGEEISLDAYTEKCRELLAADPTLVEVYALDVIGDWRASLRNTEEMWRRGIEAVPCFHYGEPWTVLTGLSRDYPKVAIGGCVGKRDADAFVGQCFARVWPKPLHGFGFGNEKSIMTFPWHSVDATSWETTTCAYGKWRSFGNQRISVRGSAQNLRAEVQWFIDLEKRAREKWAPQMEKLDLSKFRGLPNCCRLVTGTGRSASDEGIATTFGEKE
jgi:hypothetical protein